LRENYFLNFAILKKVFTIKNKKKIVLTNKIRDVFAIASRQKSINKLFFRNSKKVSNIAQNKRICYNCEKKKHIARNCFKSSKKTQVNIIKNF